MSKERIFELIRKEETALFVGAGMSLYAGYPSGVKLAEILYNNLTKDLQEQLNFTTDLPKLAEEIYYLKNGNKNYLIEILKNEFKKEPISTETHKLLAKIPQIKTIITTNYDELFEKTNKNIEVIRKSSDCATANFKKQSLFKIHGDLSDTTNIILTNSDYNNYFVKEKEHSVFWNTVKTKLVENHIVFIGYALEDSNVMVIIDKILNELGDNHKEMFFVAPNIQPAKLKFLQNKGIEYIQTTAEELFKEIEEDLKYNYLPGLDKGVGSADTAFNFAKSNDLSIELGQTNNAVTIKGAKSLKGGNHNEVKFELELPDAEKDKILNSITGKDFDDVVLESRLIKDYGLFINGIRLWNKDNIKKIELKKVPSLFGLFNIVCEDGFELDNYNLEIFVINPNENQARIKIKAKNFEILITLDFTENFQNNKIHIEIEADKSITSVKSGLNFYNILSRIVSNQSFKILKDNKLIYHYKEKISFDKNAFGASYLADYFNKLKKIENYFDVQFIDIKLDKLSDKNIRYINAYIDKIVLEEEFSGMSFNNEDKKEYDFLIEGEYKDKVLLISDEKISIYKLHGIDFEIGYLHKYVQNAYIDNLEDLKSEKTKVFSMKSKSDKIFYQFTDDKSMIEKK